MVQPVTKCCYADDVPFSKEDARKIRQPPSDPLVTMIALEEFNAKGYWWIMKALLMSCV